MVVHLFRECDIASRLWVCVKIWLRIDIHQSFIPRSITNRHDSIKLPRNNYRLAQLWVIWRLRNEKIFSKDNGSKKESLCYVLFLWFSSRNLNCNNSSLADRVPTKSTHVSINCHKQPVFNVFHKKKTRLSFIFSTLGAYSSFLFHVS